MNKLLILVLALVMVFCLAACGDEEPEITPTPTDPAGPTDAPTEAPTDEPTDPPHEHAYTSEVIMDSTCTENGEVRYTCDCGESYTEQLELSAHNWGVWYVDVEPTYTTTGTEKHMCTVCRTTETRETPTNNIEQELARYATLACMLPKFESANELEADHSIFNWVRFMAGAISSEYNETTFQVTNVYSLDTFDAVTMNYFGVKLDFVTFANNQEEMTIDTEKNQLIWVTYGMGGWELTALDRYTQVDDTHYVIRYYAYYDENDPLYYGILNVEFTGNGFIIESHTSDN